MSNQELNIEKIIKKAVKEGIKAEHKIKINDQELSPYKLTEKTLYEYNDIKKFIENCKLDIEDLKKCGLPQKSKSIVFMPSGCRVSSTDMLDAKIQDLEYKIKVNENELKKIDKALNTIKDDEYYNIIELKYLNKDKRLNDDEIAAKLYCDRSTICRNRNRLVLKMAVIIYGMDALS